MCNNSQLKKKKEKKGRERNDFEMRHVYKSVKWKDLGVHTIRKEKQKNKSSVLQNNNKI